MLHLETQVYVYNSPKNGITKHFIYYGYLVPNSENVASECAMIKYSSKVLGKEGVFSFKNDDGQIFG